MRNAAEYTEDHLLLQHAIRRFFVRGLFLSHISLENIGRELIVELIQAGYLRGGEFGGEVAAHISNLAKETLKSIDELQSAGVKRETAGDWMLSDLAVETENLLNPHNTKNAVAYTAFQHFSEVLPRRELIATTAEEEVYAISLYIAVQQALLKSDLAIVRHDLIRAYDQTPTRLVAYVDFCHKVDELFLSKLTARLKRTVSRNAAPFRVLRSFIDARPTEAIAIIGNRQRLLEVFDSQTNSEYGQIGRLVNRGIIKSIIFILITKVLIGVGVEVPYDLVFDGGVIWLPLIINLAVPPIYMASLKLSLTMPASTNARALRGYIDTIFYTTDSPQVNTGERAHLASARSKWLFTSLFIVPFGVTIYILKLLHFNPVQMIIFFIFLSTASFLGFRLSNMIRELEIGSRPAGLIATLRDYFYLPFILFGQWLSGKYAQINVVSYFLDIVIELPLKNVLRLIRQWINFLNDRREEII